MMVGEEAKRLFDEGCNCAQAVLAAFCKKIGLDQETALKLASSFGGGMGGMGSVCGAVSGMFMALGALKGGNVSSDKQKKDEHYALVRRGAARFMEEYGSMLCSELLSGVDAADKRRRCGEFVRRAAEITEQLAAE